MLPGWAEETVRGHAIGGAAVIEQVEVEALGYGGTRLRQIGVLGNGWMAQVEKLEARWGIGLLGRRLDSLMAEGIALDYLVTAPQLQWTGSQPSVRIDGAAAAPSASAAAELTDEQAATPETTAVAQDKGGAAQTPLPALDRAAAPKPPTQARQLTLSELRSHVAAWRLGSLGLWDNTVQIHLQDGQRLPITWALRGQQEERVSLTLRAQAEGLRADGSLTGRLDAALSLNWGLALEGGAAMAFGSALGRQQGWLAGEWQGGALEINGVVDIAAAEVGWALQRQVIEFAGTALRYDDDEGTQVRIERLSGVLTQRGLERSGLVAVRTGASTVGMLGVAGFDAELSGAADEWLLETGPIVLSAGERAETVNIGAKMALPPHGAAVLQHGRIPGFGGLVTYAAEGVGDGTLEIAGIDIERLAAFWQIPWIRAAEGRLSGQWRIGYGYETLVIGAGAFSLSPGARIECPLAAIEPAAKMARWAAVLLPKAELDEAMLEISALNLRLFPARADGRAGIEISATAAVLLAERHVALPPLNWFHALDAEQLVQLAMALNSDIQLRTGWQGVGN